MLPYANSIVNINDPCNSTGWTDKTAWDTELSYYVFNKIKLLSPCSIYGDKITCILRMLYGLHKYNSALLITPNYRLSEARGLPQLRLDNSKSHFNYGYIVISVTSSINDEGKFSMARADQGRIYQKRI